MQLDQAGEERQLIRLIRISLNGIENNLAYIGNSLPGFDLFFKPR